jgi:hypothetical protein
MRLRSIFRPLLIALTLAAALATGLVGVAAARTVRYHGYRLRVPAGWPVYRIAAGSRTCVRFDRHAVYLGRPSGDQRCPAHAVGRTEAVLVSPGAPAAHAALARARTGSRAIEPTVSADTVALGRSGLVATATWAHDRALVAHVIGHRLAPTATATGTGATTAHPHRHAARATGPTARPAEAIYTGLGFDACSAPSAHAMSAWGASPFRAAGVYIGGINSACAQPNLTAAWVSGVVAAGWHLIPTYVGYQGGGSCGGSCSTISSSQATAEGTAAANDAVSRAEALGIPAGNPIYDDMEQYSRSTAHTAAVLAYLSAWTTQLHAAGYLSGVYSSASSAITDLVNEQGTGYTEPDDIWVGDWNAKQTASDPYVPSSDWASHDRIHQYSGAHNDTYGGVTLNVDSDYLDGATADTARGAGAIPDGTFVQVAGTTVVYRIAGGAPLYASSWTPFGGPQPVTTISAAQFDALNAHPANGTFVQTTTGELFRFAGGAPVAVSSWSVFGSAQPDVVVDQWDIDNAANPLAHVALAPADNTVVEGLPSGAYWAFHSGRRTRSAASASAVGVDDVGLAAFPQGAGATTGTVSGAGGTSPTSNARRCVVPRLKRMTLARARTVLKKANCSLGTLRKPKHVARHHTLHVFGQSAKVRSRHPYRYRVNLWLV